MSGSFHIKSLFNFFISFFTNKEIEKPDSSHVEFNEAIRSKYDSGADLEFAAKSQAHPPDYIQGSRGYPENQPTDPKQLIH